MSTPMNLTIPTPSLTTGPAWANQVNNSLTLIEYHDHASGRGVPVTPAGMNISSDLSFGGHAATALSRAAFDSQAVAFGTGTLSSVYVVNGDLYFNDGSGTAIPITLNGAVAGITGSITGLVPPAFVAYNSGVYTFKTDITTYSVLDTGFVRVRGIGSGASNYVTLKPAATTTTYNLTLPSAVPASQALLSMSTTGVVTNALATDGTLTLTSSLLKVGTIQTANIANGAVTPAKLSAPNYVITNSCNGFTVPSNGSLSAITNCSSTFSVISSPTLRPLVVSLQYKPGSSPYDLLPAWIEVGSTSVLEIYFDISGVFSGKFGWTKLSGSGLKSVSSVSAVIVPSASGIITITAYAQLTTGTVAQITNASLVAYQL